jgi:nascent polypeptide-associated complex subunit alpha
MNFNPAQIKRMMDQFGIKNQEVPASKVTIQLKNGGEVIISNPSVVLVDMQGAKMFQITGTVEEKTGKEGEKSDAELVAESAGVDLKTAEKALKETNGDIAQAILKLKK